MPSFKFEDIPDLQDRVAIVTGGTSGIGEVCVRELARKGCRVYLFARNQGRAEEAIKRMHEHSKDIKGEITYTHCDTSDNASIQTAVQQFKSEQERLDILLNNAGIMAVPYSLSKDGVEIQQGEQA
ncbi:hypothetical protein L7F22_044210 [Adiantum nelumboides]|nr:hypothetical protein [Adiantum nelumboides]